MSQSATGEFYPLLYQLVDGYVKFKLRQAHFKEVLCKESPNSADLRATAVYLKIIGDEITASVRKISNPFSSAASEKVILEHHELFSDTTFDTKLQITVESLRNVITEMGQSVFQSKRHWGTYAAFLAFGACVAVYCSKRKALVDCVEQVAHLVTERMCQELYSWFKENGGWEKLGQAYVEDLQYYTAAQQRQVKYSQTCGLESYKLFSAKQYLGAYELAKKAVELLQFISTENEVSTSSCSSFARTMVFAITMIEDQNMALPFAKSALCVLKNSPHLAVNFRFVVQRNVLDLNLSLSTLGEFFFDVKKYDYAIWCLSNALKISEINDSHNSFDAELNYVLGVALLKLSAGGTGASEITGSQAHGIDEAVAVLKKAAKMFKCLHQHKTNSSVMQNEGFLIAEADCYYYIGKASNWNGDFGHAHEIHQKYVANKNVSPEKRIRTPLGVHRRASWSEAPDMAIEPVAPQLENTKNSCSGGSTEVSQRKVKQLSRERIAMDSLDGKVDLQMSDQEVVQRGVITYAQAVSFWGQTATDNIFSTIVNDLPAPAYYTPEQLVSEGAITFTRSEMEKFISTSSSDDIVNNLADHLNVDYKVLEKPDPQTCRIVRCFANCVRASGRTDVLKAMKGHLSAGTAGPLLPEHTLVRSLPYLTLSNLGIALSGGEEWKQLAGYLKMPQETIRFLDRRSFNPGAIVVEGLASVTDVTVGQLYDILRRCGLEAISEKL